MGNTKLSSISIPDLNQVIRDYINDALPIYDEELAELALTDGLLSKSKVMRLFKVSKETIHEWELFDKIKRYRHRSSYRYKYSEISKAHFEEIYSCISFFLLNSLIDLV